jgi:DNA-binding CsgD family transcriptional regulator
VDAGGVFGRQRELELLSASLGRMRGGLRACVLTGPAGMGKTTLWRRGVELAHDGGAEVLASRPAEAEAHLSYAGLSDVLGSVDPARLEALPEVQRRALEVAVLQRDAGETAVDARAVASGLLSALRSLTAAGPILVAVDDAQWLDPATAAALAYALRRLEESPVGVLASVRTDDSRPPTFLDAVPPERRDELTLPPLTVAAIHAVVRSELGWVPARPTLVRIAAASGGNPFHALEIVRELRRLGTTSVTGHMPTPEESRSLVRARLARLPQPTRDALLAAACLGAPTTALVDEEALAAAEEAGVVRVESDGRIRFVHPLFASGVYELAPATRRRATHRELSRLALDPEERARHLALACEAPDEDVARAVEAAARHARLRGAPDTAAELMELALRLTPSGPAALERRLVLAEHLYVAGDFGRGTELLRDPRTSFPPGDLRARALLLLSELVYRREGEPEAAALVHEALEHAHDPILRARCHMRLAGWATTSDVHEAAADIDAAHALLERSAEKEPGLRAAVLVNRVRVDVFLGRGLDLAALPPALDLEQAEPPRDVDERIVFVLGIWLRYVDDFDGARGQFEQAQRTALEEGDDSSLVNILFNRMVVELWAGEWTRADEIARELGEVAEQLSQTNVAGAWVAYVDAHHGRLDTVREAVAKADRHDGLVDMLYLRALGVAELGAGLYEDASEHLASALADIERMGTEEPAIWRIDGDAIEAALGAGELELARRLLARFEERAARSGLSWNRAVSARCRGLLHAADGELELASEALERALVEHRRHPLPFETARTLSAHGQVLRRRKQRREARESLEQARAIFARIGADAWTRRVDEELRRVAVRRAPEELSPTELRIARLAADGLTNRLIAERAFVSIKTVETNLKRAYRKLGISSRAQLARALDRLSADVNS